MISVAEATRIILEQAVNFGEEEVLLPFSTGRVLKEDLTADRDFPPFDRVSMDGIAIRYEAFAKGRRVFSIEGIQPAGKPAISLTDPEACLEVMTGASQPAHTDTVIPYEDLSIEKGKAEVVTGSVRKGQNIHSRGYDRKAGERIVPAGRLISPAEISVAAAIGKSIVRVSRPPRTVIIFTGDEVIRVDRTPLPYQIRASNAHTIQSVLAPWAVDADLMHLPDNKEQSIEGLSECIAGYDLIVLSGGISKGKFDYIPKALEELGVVCLFYKINQRPGKPFWFGKASRGATVFAFPGNPVSAFMSALRYLQPWLRKCLGLSPMAYHYAQLAEEIIFEKKITYFLQVKTRYDEEGRLIAYPVKGKGSGDLANLVDADGFLELPPEKELFPKGQRFPLILYREA